MPGAKFTFSRPIKQAPREREERKKHLAQMIREGILVFGKSYYSSPCLAVFNRGKDKSRFVSDLRRLNSISVGDRYPIPTVEEIISDVADGEIFSQSDGRKYFYQIENADDNTRRLCSLTADEGILLANRMPQGHKNSASTGQRGMDTMYHGFIGVLLRVYIDDLTIFSKTPVESDLQ